MISPSLKKLALRHNRKQYGTGSERHGKTGGLGGGVEPRARRQSPKTNSPSHLKSFKREIDCRSEKRGGKTDGLAKTEGALTVPMENVTGLKQVNVEGAECWDVKDARSSRSVSSSALLFESDWSISSTNLRC